MKKSKKLKKEYILSIGISLLIIILIFTNIYRINYIKYESKYKAEKGVIDLSNWDMNKEKVLKLDGQWEFYPGKLLDPSGDFSKEEKTYINVPENWMEHLNEEALENGSGTYRLNIKVPKDMVYAIKSRTIRFANHIYFNGEKISEVGTPSTDESDFETVSRYNLGAEKSENKEIELVVHVTSLNYRSGGILKSLEIGSFDHMSKTSNKNLALDILVVVFCFTLSLYFLIIYFQRNKNLYLLNFSIINFLTGFYLSTMNEQPLSLIYDYKPLGRTEIQGSLIIFTCIFFVKFVDSFFKEISKKKISKRLIISMIFILLYTSLSQVIGIPLNFIFMQNISFFIIFLSYIYIFTILIRGMMEERDLVEYIIVVLVSGSAYWIILFMKIFFEIDLGNIPIYLIITTMISIAALMGHQLQLDFKRATRLSDKLIKDDELKDEFLMRTSHVFKGSLENMKNLIKDLLEGEKGLLNINQQEDLIHLQQETEILKRINNDLMDASSINNEISSFRKSPVNAYEVVEEIIKEIKSLIPVDKNLILINLIKNDFPLISGDVEKFRQILYNLIHNAIKYTESGSISVSASIRGNNAEIQVKDTGIGIEERDLDEVFEKFFQKSIVGEAKEELGLGLGLTIARDLVQQQGGEIYVESTVGEGSSFRFTLALYEDKTMDKKYRDNLAKEISKEDQRKLKKREENYVNRSIPSILIIDENTSNLKDLQNIIGELECYVNTANTGHKALEIIKKEKIDLVILDFMLTDISSYELCKEVRKSYSMGELPILILTSSGRTRDLMGTFNYGVNDFQKKPIDPKELKSRVQSLLLIKSTADEGLEKEFQYFYSQISPHFLYNTLNSIIGLSYKDGDKARQALNNLAVYLRGKLDIHRKKGFVSLETELELVRAYLEIEKLRYGERLEVVYNIEKGLNAKIPPLTLQPIIENAVNHGIAGQDRGKLEIITKKEKGFINISIQDNGKGMTYEERKQLLEGNGKGIGFKNVMERIKILKGASLTLETELGKGTRVKIIIPEVKNSGENENILS